LLAPGAQADQLVSTTFDCLIEPHQVVKLASCMVGVVAELHVDRGDVVSKAQLLGKLEDGVEEANLALAKARARNEYAIKSIQARFEFLSKVEPVNSPGNCAPSGGRGQTVRAAAQ
jgi:multidrug efflux pump subunit AcrA (membrane-fusion protein)